MRQRVTPYEQEDQEAQDQGPPQQGQSRQAPPRGSLIPRTPRTGVTDGSPRTASDAGCAFSGAQVRTASPIHWAALSIAAGGASCTTPITRSPMFAAASSARHASSAFVKTRWIP